MIQISGFLYVKKNWRGTGWNTH